jgi:hypothetical protein
MFADKYSSEARKLKETIRQSYWDPSRRLFADTLDREHWSQHANSLAVLAEVTTAEEARSVVEKTLSDRSLTPASIYFTYYVRLAMRKAGLGDRYLAMLDRPWRWALEYGFTTWPEQDTPSTRSDCHAWGSSPNIELFRTVLGIDSAAPGFKRVLAQPNLGDLTSAAGSMPHPKGSIAVRYSRGATGELGAEISLPEGITGELIWSGRKAELKSGQNRLTL